MYGVEKKIFKNWTLIAILGPYLTQNSNNLPCSFQKEVAMLNFECAMKDVDLVTTTEEDQLQ